jgi:hypothetical protein
VTVSVLVTVCLTFRPPLVTVSMYESVTLRVCRPDRTPYSFSFGEAGSFFTLALAL